MGQALRSDDAALDAIVHARARGCSLLVLEVTTHAARRVFPAIAELIARDPGEVRVVTYEEPYVMK